MVHKIDMDKNSVTINGDDQNNVSQVLSKTESEIVPTQDFWKPHSSKNSIISSLKQTNLRTKAIAFAFAVGTLPVLLVGTLTYHLVNKSAIKEITQSKQEKASLLVDNINHFLLKQYEDVQILSKRSFLNNSNLRQSISREQIQKELSNYIDIEDAYESIALFDINGNLISESQGQFIPNQQDQEYFQTVLKGKKPNISQLLSTTSMEKSKIYFTAPVQDSQTGQPLYIIRLTMPVKSLLKVVKVPHLNQENYGLVDSSGKIVLSNDSLLFGKDAQQEIPQWKQLQTKNQIETIISFSKREQTEELITYVPEQTLEKLPDLKWKFFLTTPTSAALANHRESLLTLQLGTLFIAILVSAIATIIVNRLLQPIVAATMTVKKLGQGNLDTRIAIEGEDEFAVLGSHINHMADQLQNLLEKQTAESEKLTSLANILLLIRSSLNTEDLFKITVTHVRQVLQADRVVICQIKSHGGGQIIAESVGSDLPVAFGQILEDMFIDQETIEAYRNGHILVTSNVSDTLFSAEHLKVIEKLQIKAKLVTPILKDNQVFGFLMVHHCLSNHPWQPDEINFMRQVSVQVGITLERVSLLEATQFLKNFAIRLAGTPNSQKITNLAVQDIRQALKVERVVIYQFDSNWQGKIVEESVVNGWPNAIDAEINDPCFLNYVDKYKQGRVVAINNIYEAGLSDCYIQQLEPFAVKANLVAPILVGDQLLGLLIAHHCSQTRVWQQSEIDLFEQLARIIGMGLERANLLEQAQKERKAAEVFSEQQMQQKERLQLQLLQLINDIQGASRGDLTVRTNVMEGDIGTIAEFFNSIVDSLRDIVTSVKLVATQVDESIAENSGAISQLAIKALEQKDQINHTLESVEQMRGSIQEVAISVLSPLHPYAERLALSYAEESRAPLPLCSPASLPMPHAHSIPMIHAISVHISLQ